MSDSCQTCGKQLDPNTEAVSDCYKCGAMFCNCWRTVCFTQHLKDCKGTPVTILNPEWKVNLRPMPEESSE